MSDGLVADVLEKKLLTDLSQVDALSSPIRMRILQGAVEPVTVGVLAERFGLPKTRLYYHVNLLVREGLLIQVDERKSGARVERIYRTVARTFAPGPELSASVDDARQAARLETGLALDPARTEAETMLEKKFRGEATTGDVVRLLVRVTDDYAEEFSVRLANLCAELEAQTGAEDGSLYALSFVFAPMDLGTDS